MCLLDRIVQGWGGGAAWEDDPTTGGAEVVPLPFTGLAAGEARGAEVVLPPRTAGRGGGTGRGDRTTRGASETVVLPCCTSPALTMSA